MKIGTVFNNINVVENITYAKNKIKTTTVELLNTLQPYAKPAAKSAVTLATATVFFKVISSPFFVNPQNHLFSALISLTVGASAGLMSTSFSSTIEKLTVIGVGLLANQIVIPAYLPTYSLSTIATIFINLIGASIATGSSDGSESPTIDDLSHV